MTESYAAQPIPPQLYFGIELEKLYPVWYLHPALKNLMFLATLKFRNHCNMNDTVNKIEDILGKDWHKEESIKERLLVKEHLIYGKDILKFKMSADVPFWVLKHFLGKLPVPIFPPKIHKYWTSFSKLHEFDFKESVDKKETTKSLRYIVAVEIANLPAANLTFLFDFFDTLRTLCSNKDRKSINKKSCQVLVRYFTPSMFSRPYTPDVISKNDRKYMEFLMYIIYFWPSLRSKIQDFLVEPQKTKKLNKHISDCVVCTNYYANKIETSQINLDSLTESSTSSSSSVSDYSLKKSSICLDKSSCKETSSRNSVSENMNIDKFLNKYTFKSLNKQPSFLRTISTQTSDNKDDFIINVESLKPNCESNHISKDTEEIRIQNLFIVKVPKQKKKLGVPVRVLSPIKYKKRKSYKSPKRAKQNLILDNKSSDKKSSSSKESKMKTESSRSDIFRKVSKLGWTYNNTYPNTPRKSSSVTNENDKDPNKSQSDTQLSEHKSMTSLHKLFKKKSSKQSLYNKNN